MARITDHGGPPKKQLAEQIHFASIRRHALSRFSLTCLAAYRLLAFGRFRFQIVEIQHRVEQHPELAQILPPIARIRGKQYYTPFSHRNVDDGRSVANLVCALHQAAQNGLVATWESH